MPTYAEIVALSDKGLTDSMIVGQLVSVDYMSREKMDMVKAEKYYNNRNDVMDLDFTEYEAGGVKKNNLNRSNRRISHNFFKLLVNQAVNYIAGNPVTYKTTDNKVQEYLDQLFMFDFDDANINLLKEARKKGKGYLHIYYDKDGKLQYAVIPSEQIIPIYKDGFTHDLQEVIRYYSVYGVDDRGKEVIRKKVEWWTATEGRKYIEDEPNQFTLMEIVPHWSTYNTNTPDIVEAHGWGRVPFVQLWNNDEGTGDLQDIKVHVDAYDLLQSEFVNQIADVREILIKVMGYSGTDATEIMKAFRSTGIVKIDDPTGNVDVLKTEIPVEARQAALKILNDNIFKIGQGVDPDPAKFGTNITGIALKMLYGALDLKCSASIRKFKKSLYQLSWFVIESYNRQTNSSFDYRDINFVINKNMITNDAEIIESLAKSKGLISDETIIEHHPYVDDPTQEEERMKKQEEAQMDQFNAAINQQNNNVV